MQSLLTSDEIKILYRGNLTIRQAAKYMGRSAEWILLKVEFGEIGTNSEGTRISRQELDRWMRVNTTYKKQIFRRGVKLVGNY